MGYFGLIVGIILFVIRRITNYELRITDRKNQNYNSTQIALACGWISVLVTNFFGFSVVITSLFFFLFPAMITVLNQSPTPNKQIQTRPLYKSQYFGIGLVLLFMLHNSLFMIRYWKADFHYANGLKLNRQHQYLAAFGELQTALALKEEANYHDEIAWSAANLAVIAQKQKETELAKQFTQTAQEQSAWALKISPYQINFWKSRAKIFYKLAEIEPKDLKVAIEALTAASELAPTDAKIRYNLGGLTGNVEDIKKALELKPNYEEAKKALEKLETK